MQKHISVKIPLSMPDIERSDRDAVLSVLKTPYLSLGPRVTEFEEKIRSYIGTKYAVAVNSGTSALHLIVRALGIGKGDEVITTPFSFVSSSNCILYEGARPVFVDIDRKTLNIDPDKIARAISKNTRAILAVDVFGHPADWSKLKKIANKFGLALIEDSAEALGSEYNGIKCGKFADAAVFSFYPNKQITTGEGGIVVTDDKKIAEICQSMSNQGRRVRCGMWLEHLRLGYNYRMSDINAALGLTQLSRIKHILRKRQRVADMYGNKLREIKGVGTPSVARNAKLAWFVYVVRLLGITRDVKRDIIIESMAKKGIQCSDYFRPIHMQPFYRKLFGYKKGDMPVCEEIAGQTMALPFYNNLKMPEIDNVVRSLRDVLRSA